MQEVLHPCHVSLDRLNATIEFFINRGTFSRSDAVGCEQISPLHKALILMFPQSGELFSTNLIEVLDVALELDFYKMS